MQLRKEAFLMKEKNELLVKRNIALETQVKSLTLDYSQLETIKNDFRDRVQTQNEYVSTMEDRVYKSNKISLELLKQLKDAELEIDCLK
jgi:abortive infection bacteriophage resistance protein